MEKFKKIILNIPHSSIVNYDYGWNGRQNFFNETKDLVDWHTDIIFNCNSDLEMKKLVVPIVFPYSRFYIDFERLVNDPMESIGQGILYTEYKGHKRTIDVFTKEYLLSLYEAHRKRFDAELLNGTILVDCHSFSDDGSGIDVCIGFNEDESKPTNETIEAIEKCFTEKGYVVALNKPFSNSITPKSPIDYKSVMIEINKKTYMDEKTLLLHNDNYKKIEYCINKVYKALLRL